MKAKVIKTFPGAADGEVYPRYWAPGEEVAGNLAEVAVREGWAEEIRDAAPAAPAAAEPAKAKGKGKKAG